MHRSRQVIKSMSKFFILFSRRNTTRTRWCPWGHKYSVELTSNLWNMWVPVAPAPIVFYQNMADIWDQNWTHIKRWPAFFDVRGPMFPSRTTSGEPLWICVNSGQNVLKTEGWWYFVTGERHIHQLVLWGYGVRKSSRCLTYCHCGRNDITTYYWAGDTEHAPGGISHAGCRSPRISTATCNITVGEATKMTATKGNQSTAGGKTRWWNQW